MPDVIVLGLGAAGSATAYQLARRGSSVLGIDQFTPPHTFGSSHGDTRITRQGVGEGEVYPPLAILSHQIWREVEAETGADLLSESGYLLMSRPSINRTHHAKANFFNRAVAMAERFEIPHERLETAEIARRFPAFSLVGDEVGYYEPSGGFLRPEACVKANLELAQRHGAELRFNSKVTAWSATPDGISIVCDGETIHASTLIISVGAWMGKLLGPAFTHLFRLSRQYLCWFEIANHYELFTKDHLPTFMWDVDSGFGFYGFPAIDGPGGGIKLAAEASDSIVDDPDSVLRQITEAQIQQLFDPISPRLPQLSSRCLRYVTCIYTETPDGDFIIDHHPDHDNVIIASPCSGHGFKHSAAVGETIAELALNRATTLNIAPFSVGRFTAN